jgi:hypothetical protein
MEEEFRKCEPNIFSAAVQKTWIYNSFFCHLYWWKFHVNKYRRRMADEDLHFQDEGDIFLQDYVASQSRRTELTNRYCSVSHKLHSVKAWCGQPYCLCCSLHHLEVMQLQLTSCSQWPKQKMLNLPGTYLIFELHNGKWTFCNNLYIKF